MFNAIGTALAWLYDLTHSYGLSIMLLTLGIMVLLTPLTLKGTRSMIAMQRLQPEMKKLQSKYKDDRQKLNEEMLKFYKEHNINPVGGCLPLLLQTPVFIVLYRVLHGLTNSHPYGEDMGHAFGLAGGSRNAVFEQFGTFDPSYLKHTTELFKDLSSVREMNFAGLDLATSAAKTFSEGIVHALPYLALIAVIGVTAWYQQRQIQGRNPQMAQQVNPQQQMLMKIFPYFLPLISFTLPAGIVLYFLVSNLYRIGQQAFITRTMYHDAHGNPVINTTATPTDKPAGARKGLFAQLRESVAESGPKVGPNANGGKGAPKGGAAKKATVAKKATSNTKKTTTSAKKTVPKKTVPKKTTPAPAPAADEAEKAAGTGGASPRDGAAKPSRQPPAPRAETPAPPRSGASPSRRPPAPNPNRARAKKKRR
jgi:YidC/Oxa1 family membrane protein insertase